MVEYRLIELKKKKKKILFPDVELIFFSEVMRSVFSVALTSKVLCTVKQRLFNITEICTLCRLHMCKYSVKWTLLDTVFNRMGGGKG